MIPETRSESEPQPRVPISLEEGIAAGAMAVIVVVSLLNVVVRYLTNFSFAFTEELSVFMLVLMAFFGSAVAFARGEHIRITFFLDRMPRALRWVLSVITLLATLVIFALVTWYGFWFAYEGWLYEETTPGLGLPEWMFSLWMPVASAVIMLRVAGRFLRRLRQGVPD